MIILITNGITEKDLLMHSTNLRFEDEFVIWDLSDGDTVLVADLQTPLEGYEQSIDEVIEGYA